jgi:hypothetical protein
MPLSLRRGRVTAVTERLDGLVRLEVDGVACVSYPRLTGDVEEGDDVLVNEQARLLELGSGGFDVLYANLTRGLALEPEPGAHVMALPYTPGQLALRRGEEDGRGERSLAGLPVVCCTLHSQLAPVCAGLGRGRPVAYVQLGGGALPVSLSDTIRTLKAAGFLDTAIAVAPCLDGDIDCVTVASALLWARQHGHAAAVCGIGPGIVGTATELGHGGLAALDAAIATQALGGSAVLAARVSDSDARERHRGLSHHTRAVLELAPTPLVFAWPDGLDGAPPAATVVDVDGWQEASAGLPLSHMGRGPEEDPWFFAAAYAAGRLASEALV